MMKMIFTSSALIVGMMLAAPATALVITPVFDQSITSMANSSAIQAAFIVVAKDYAQSFSSSANVRIGVSWGSVGGQVLPSNAVGASLNNLYGYYSYSQVKTMLSRVASANPGDVALIAALKYLPTTLTSGPTSFVISSAQAKALGVISPTQSSLDASIGFAGSTSNYAFTPGAVTASTYDFQSIAAHEIDEVLGRISGVDNGKWRTPFDLFRYSAPGVLSYGYNSAAYFSLDGGATVLNRFNNSASGGDRGDWATTAGTSDIQDAFIGKGQRKNLSAVDLAALDVIGWSGANLGNASGGPKGIAFNLDGTVPEPATWALLITGFGLVGATQRRRRAAGASAA